MTEEQGEPTFVDRIREAGPAGIILGALVMGAIAAVVVVSMSQSPVESEAGETTDASAVTLAASEPETPVVDDEPQPVEGLDRSVSDDDREAVLAFLDCMQGHGIRVRAEGASETEIVFATRAGTGMIAQTDSPEADQCYDDHLASTGRSVRYIEVERGVDTTVGSGDDTSAAPIETTDSTVVEIPTTDTTTP